MQWVLEREREKLCCEIHSLILKTKAFISFKNKKLLNSDSKLNSAALIVPIQIQYISFLTLS